MTKKTMTLAILSALCAAPLFAAAQHAIGPGMAPGTGHGAERFARLDADHNGSISADEMKAEVARRFASFDQNKDGRVTQQEAETFVTAKREAWSHKRAEHAGERFAARDTDKDGRLSKQELAGMPGDRFEQLDLNGDGFVTTDEMEQGHAAMREERGKHGAGRGAELFTRLDTNHDGAVDKAEVDAQTKQRFERKDADHDGVLTGNELDRHHGEACEGRQHGNRDASARGQQR